MVPGIGADWSRRTDGKGWGVYIGPRVSFRGSSRIQGSLSAGYSRGVVADQFVNNFGAVGSDTTHYTVARLDQTTASLTARLDVTASPTLSLQVYAQPYISNGLYHNWRELRDPRAEQWEDRWQPYSDTRRAASPQAVRRQCRGAVGVSPRLHGVRRLAARAPSGRCLPGSFTPRRDFNNLFSAVPQNVFLIKAFVLVFSGGGSGFQRRETEERAGDFQPERSPSCLSPGLPSLIGSPSARVFPDGGRAWFRSPKRRLCGADVVECNGWSYRLTD